MKLKRRTIVLKVEVEDDDQYADLIAKVVKNQRITTFIYTGASKRTNDIIEAKTGKAMGWSRTSANEFARSKSGKL